MGSAELWRIISRPVSAGINRLDWELGDLWSRRNDTWVFMLLGIYALGPNSTRQLAHLSRLDIKAGVGAQKRDLGVVISAFVEVLAITPRSLTDEEKIT